MIIYSQVFLLLAASVVSDLRSSKIKNTGVFFFLISGILSNYCLQGLEGLKLSLAGAAIPVLLLVLFFYLRLLGAGDIKLYSAIGALLGWKAGLYVLAYSMLAAGVVSFAKLYGTGEARRGFTELFHEIILFFNSAIPGNQLPPPVNINNRHVIKLSPAIAFGTGLQLLTGLLL
ncbi:type IV leader peptidase family protein [Ruminiclostridium hungatei]|uniref:Type IV leader peptidase family protein n=1 Tax=Ruminiclostridium hungatei TaxID=48256 RepID=A0A1V4SQZ4_RUMHU|nr:A24 family peptidase [Ruminiclostridium hungatei]OPX46282.1 type IV leader peptidase family protein [Ruminiclostridium hungatei]